MRKSKTIGSLCVCCVRCPKNPAKQQKNVVQCTVHKHRADMRSYSVDNISFGRITICHLNLLHISADADAGAVVCLFA